MITRDDLIKYNSAHLSLVKALNKKEICEVEFFINLTVLMDEFLNLQESQLKLFEYEVIIDEVAN